MVTCTQCKLAHANTFAPIARRTILQTDFQVLDSVLFNATVQQKKLINSLGI